MLKKLLLLFAAGTMALSLTGCAGQMESLQTLEAPSSGITQTAVDDDGFDDNLDGLCKYMEANNVVAGDKVEMSYKEIGAIGGYRYRFKFDGGTVQAEFYEYDMDALDEKGRECVSSVQEKGYFTVLGNDAPAVLNGKYLMVYTDSDSDEVNTARKDDVEELFMNFGN